MTPEENKQKVEKLQKLVGEGFGPGNPLYREGSGVVNRIDNSLAWCVHGLLRLELWKARGVQGADERDATRMGRLEEREMTWRLDSTERDRVFELHMHAMQTGSPEDKRAHLEAKKQLHSNRVERIGKRIISLETDRPFRAKAKIRRAKEKQATQLRRANRAAGKLIKYS